MGGGAGARRRLQQGDLSNDRQHVTRALHIFYRYADNSTALTDSMVKLVRRAAVLQAVSQQHVCMTSASLRLQRMCNKCLCLAEKHSRCGALGIGGDMHRRNSVALFSKHAQSCIA